MNDLIGLAVGPVCTNDLPDNLWVASMFAKDFSGVYALPTSSKVGGDSDGFAMLVSNRATDLAQIIQNHYWSKLIKVKMLTSKRYTADLNGVACDIVIETVKEHKVRLEAYRKTKEIK